MPPAPDLYAAHAATIEAALAHAGRAHRLAPDAADEFSSWARLRLIDNDQAILRKFEGRSSLRTFLITVVQRLYLDWRNAEWGKWRPTTDARRLGPVAMELERHVLRDGLTVDEAMQTLVSKGLATADECEQAWLRLPRRPRRRRVDDRSLAELPAADRASDSVDGDAARAEAAKVADALDRAMRALPPTDQVMLQLRYWGGQTVPRIAATTGEDPKALYRRFERLAAELRRALENEGVSGAAVAALTSRVETPAGQGSPVAVGSAAFGPSPVTSTGGKHG